jgi:hypothetical protein
MDLYNFKIIIPYDDANYRLTLFIWLAEPIVETDGDEEVVYA